MFRIFTQWARRQGKTARAEAEYERGKRCAQAFLDTKPTLEEIGRNYGYSRGAPDQTGFDRGWCEVLRLHLVRREK